MPSHNPEDPLANTIHAADTGMDPVLLAQAQQAAEKEKAMTFKQALPIFWRGAFWSGILSVALIMEGFDVVQVSREGKRTNIQTTTGPSWGWSAATWRMDRSAMRKRTTSIDVQST